MDEADFGPYLDRLIRSYSVDNIRAGRWSEKEALVESRKEILRSLPAGRETANQFFFTIAAGPTEEKVGAIWLGLEPRGGFVVDLIIFELFRRRGYAHEAMLLLEQFAREKGAGKLSLQVFGENQGARKLYAKLGYTETNVFMSKMLAP